MAELKAGGLAIVISSPIAKNVGRVVELVEFRGTLKSRFTGEEGPAWKVKTDTPMTLPNGMPSDLIGWIFSKKLMPIDGDDFQYEDERQKELTHG